MLKRNMVTLGFIGSVERLAVHVVARAGMVAAYDEMSAAMIFADQTVPNGFPRAAHPHSQR
jgi:hypothetical protein